MPAAEAHAQAERLLAAALDDVSAAVLSLATTQPGLALEAFEALGQAVYPYLRGDRRAEGLLMRLRAAEGLRDALNAAD